MVHKAVHAGAWSLLLPTRNRFVDVRLAQFGAAGSQLPGCCLAAQFARPAARQSILAPCTFHGSIAGFALPGKVVGTKLLPTDID